MSYCGDFFILLNLQHVYFASSTTNAAHKNLSPLRPAAVYKCFKLLQYLTRHNAVLMGKRMNWISKRRKTRYDDIEAITEYREIIKMKCTFPERLQNHKSVRDLVVQGRLKNKFIKQNLLKWRSFFNVYVTIFLFL